jgi:hypothetical protein
LKSSKEINTLNSLSNIVNGFPENARKKPEIFGKKENFFGGLKFSGFRVK